MNKNLAVQAIAFIVVLVATALGFVCHQSDLIFAGMISSLIILVSIIMGPRKGYLKNKHIIVLPLLMIPCIIVNVHDFGYWADILGTVPIYMDMALLIILMIVGYCGVRLDALMMGVYQFFASLSMGGFIGAGYYIYNITRHITEETAQIANYWIGWEYLTVAVASIIFAVIISKSMAKFNIKLLQAEHVLEAEQ